MILRFKPNDFEECLMGLPIENWLLVDETTFEEDNFIDHGLSRPKMLISHLKELKGITVTSDVLKIRGFTTFDEILAHHDIPLYFKTVVEKAWSLSVVKHLTLGCHLTSRNFDRILYPMLVASDAKILMKSYMKEREVNFKEFTATGKVQFMNYNEIIYELILPKRQYDHMTFDSVDFPDIQGDTKFSYFMGYNDHVVNMAIMLPNKRVYRFESMERLIAENNFVLDEFVKTELLKFYNSLIKNLRLQLKYKGIVNKIFEEIIWKPLQETLKGRV